jgi:hypothetical protein
VAWAGRNSSAKSPIISSKCVNRTRFFPGLAAPPAEPGNEADRVRTSGVHWASGSAAYSDHHHRRRHRDWRSAIAEGADSRQVAIRRARQRGPGEDQNNRENVAEGAHLMSPLTIQGETPTATSRFEASGDFLTFLCWRELIRAAAILNGPLAAADSRKRCATLMGSCAL